jgi:hypothetical protein
MFRATVNCNVNFLGRLITYSREDTSEGSNDLALDPTLFVLTSESNILLLLLPPPGSSVTDPRFIFFI